MKRLLAGWLLFASFAAWADDWSASDKAMFATSTALLAADWMQTRYIARNPCANAGGGKNCTDPYRETGAARHFIGEHPSIGRVNTYFAAAIAANYLITDALGPKHRRAWQIVVIAAEGATVARNYRIGIRMELP